MPAVPRWTGSERPVIQGSSFLAPVRWPDGSQARRPVFFTGFGHLAAWWRISRNGRRRHQHHPDRARTEPHLSAARAADEAPVRELEHTLDRAQKAGVAICLLISPHYLPDWALARWPQLHRRREGFLRYCLHAPEGQELLQRFLEVLLEPIKNHPALHSICLSNEPVNKEEPCDAARKEWQTWLQQRHGNLGRLNERHGSHYAKWLEVPLPDPFGPLPAAPLTLDYVRFNQEFFAHWHARCSRTACTGSLQAFRSMPRP